jgi:tRNA threonylcarbamoyladenosine biosynthesis protein TsaB
VEKLTVRRQNLPMLFVALETSSLQGGVALFENGECLQETCFSSGPDRGRELLPAVGEALRAAGRTPQDLDGIAVGRGPGSYTGMRLGVTAAKTLAFALRCPVVAESSLRVMAVNALIGSGYVSSGGARSNDPLPSSYVATVLDGRQTFLYGALYELRPGCLDSGSPERPPGGSLEGAVEVLVDDRVTDFEGLTREFSRATGPTEAPIVLIGDGADLFLERCGDREAGAYVRGSTDWDVASARALGYLTAARLGEARFSALDAHRLAPAYLRSTEAERKLAGT